jgi:hypothetical protein
MYSCPVTKIFKKFQSIFPLSTIGRMSQINFKFLFTFSHKAETIHMKSLSSKTIPKVCQVFPKSPLYNGQAKAKSIPK